MSDNSQAACSVSNLDQVCINTLNPDNLLQPDERLLELLAPG